MMETVEGNLVTAEDSGHQGHQSQDTLDLRDAGWCRRLQIVDKADLDQMRHHPSMRVFMQLLRLFRNHRPLPKDAILGTLNFLLLSEI